jgi:hypothetical protein
MKIWYTNNNNTPVRVFVGAIDCDERRIVTYIKAPSLQSTPTVDLTCSEFKYGTHI